MARRAARWRRCPSPPPPPHAQAGTWASTRSPTARLWLLPLRLRRRRRLLETEAPTRANVFSLGKLCVWEPHARPAPPGGGAAAPVLPNRRRRLSPWAAVDCLLVAVGTFSIFLVAVLVAVLVLARSPHSLVAHPAQSPSLGAHGPLSDAVNESQLPPAPSAAANAAAAEACAA